jgi:selenium metabolism protein YedF
MRLAKSLKASCQVDEKDNFFAVTIERGAGAEAVGQVQAVVKSAAGKKIDQKAASEVSTVVFLSSDRLGDGDEDFSKTLLNLFLQTIFDSGLKPQAILMVNSGVRLMAKSSQALKVLNDFKAAGVEVLACGLCLEFYKIKDDVPKEQITNMFAICEYLFAAGKVLKP